MKTNIRALGMTRKSGMVYEPKTGCVVNDLRPWGAAKFEIATFDCVKEPS